MFASNEIDFAALLLLTDADLQQLVRENQNDDVCCCLLRVVFRMILLFVCYRVLLHWYDSLFLLWCS